MLIIKHRVNKSSELKKLKKNYGTEIDIRSHGSKLYLHHDPFKKGEDFVYWLKCFAHKFIVLNVKEEGLENKILKILNKYKIKNFFFHDQSFSSMIKNSKKTNVSARLSEYEEINELQRLCKEVKWFWVDYFTKFNLSKKSYNIIKRNNRKICIVSPELVSKKNFKNNILKLKKIIKNNRYKIDAVCTKYPVYWT
jgi:hypothetical protein